MLEALLHGALAGGVNGPTLVLLNTCLIACIFVLASLLVPTLGLPSALLPHIAVLLLLAVGLLVSINWLIAQTGTVPVEAQRRELFGGEQGQEAAGAAVEAASQGVAAAAGASGAPLADQPVEEAAAGAAGGGAKDKEQ